MKFIGNIDRLQSDSLAYRVYDKLNSILNDGEDSLLYYMFPVYSGNIDVGKVECNLCCFLVLMEFSILTQRK